MIGRGFNTPRQFKPWYIGAMILKNLLWPFRKVMSVLIRVVDRLTRPKSLVRSTEKQALIDQQTAGLVLYHFEACPFCVKVRRHVLRLGLNIEMRDIKVTPSYADELVKGGGEYQAPCLRISAPGAADQWMYESSDINAYLSSRFAG
jgi:glutaredoxin